MNYVFISFKTEERDIALKLKSALEGAGFKVWWHEEIQCGQEWHGEIDKAIESASAIVILWSQKSIKSPWVRHEASQAIIKGVYAPVRIEMFEIENPYNRIQATDMLNWDADIQNTSGFQNLLGRLQILVPPPQSFSARLSKFLWQQRASVILALILLLSLWLLLNQKFTLDDQIGKQAITLELVQKQKKTLENQQQALNSQVGRLDQLFNEGEMQNKSLKIQFSQLSNISNDLTKQRLRIGEQLVLQNKAKEQSDAIVSAQSGLLNELMESSSMIAKNMKLQEQSANVINNTAKGLDEISIPLKNGLSYQFTFRIYIDKQADIWKDKEKGKYLMINSGDFFGTYANKNIVEFPLKEYRKYDETYAKFFGDISSMIGVTTKIEYKKNNKGGVIRFHETNRLGGIGKMKDNFNFSAINDIYYNPAEKYFETSIILNCGAFESNPENIFSLNQILDDSEIYLFIKYMGDEKFNLPLKDKVNEVKIKNITISEFKEMAYGLNFRSILNLKDKVSGFNYIEKEQLLSSMNIDPKEMWRYYIVTFHLGDY